MSDHPVVKFRGLWAGFERGGRLHHVFRGANLDLEEGDLACLIGPSGSGKTVLLNLLIGALRPGARGLHLKGGMEIMGRDASTRFPEDLTERIGIVFQESALFEDLTTRENVAFGLKGKGLNRNEIGSRVDGLLDSVGLTDPPARIHMLSGGQKKRLALARTLARSPEFLIFDEPTTGLDPKRCRQIASLIAQTHAEGGGRRTTLVVTHDYEAVLPVASKVFLINPADGLIERVQSGDDLAARLDEIEKAGEGVTAAPAPLRPLAWLDVLFNAPWRWLEPFFRFLATPWPGSGRQMLLRFADALVHPALYVCAAGAVLGGLATFFALENNPLKGAMDRQAIIGLGKVVMAIVVPLMTSVLFAARLGAGAAARLGNIRLGRQDDALRMMGRSSTAHLVTPLFWSCIFGLPLLTFPVEAAGALASLAFACANRPITLYGWASAFFYELNLMDLCSALIKLAGSGALVAGAAAYLGLRPKSGAEDLGRDVTSTIVAATFLVILWHGVWTVVLYG
jgi:ABC-type multidrug transport system ATPase subunit/ABC-type transporter Mla maintaining outer membrane lipid asymmetry permease subunit MlaE